MSALAIAPHQKPWPNIFFNPIIRWNLTKFMDVVTCNICLTSLITTQGFLTSNLWVKGSQMMNYNWKNRCRRHLNITNNCYKLQPLPHPWVHSALGFNSLDGTNLFWTTSFHRAHHSCRFHQHYCSPWWWTTHLTLANCHICYKHILIKPELWWPK
jgi:hypothetical protein